MGRRTNYGFEKRQKELKRQKKKEEKLARRRARKDGLAEGEPVNGEPASPEEAPGDTGEVGDADDTEASSQDTSVK